MKQLDRKAEAALKGELLDMLLKTYQFYHKGSLFIPLVNWDGLTKANHSDSCWSSNLSDYFKKWGICWHFILSRHGNKTKKPWPINGASAQGQMWAGVVMAALLPPPAGGYRQKTVTGGCRGRRHWCEQTASLQSTAVYADRCHILWHSVGPANQRCLWKITTMCKEQDSSPAILLRFWVSHYPGSYVYVCFSLQPRLGNKTFHV